MSKKLSPPKLGYFSSNLGDFKIDLGKIFNQHAEYTIFNFSKFTAARYKHNIHLEDT